MSGINKKTFITSLNGSYTEVIEYIAEQLKRKPDSIFELTIELREIAEDDRDE